MSRLVSSVVGVLVLIGIACSGSSGPVVEDAADRAILAKQVSQPDGGTGHEASLATHWAERKLIRNARLELELENVDDAISRSHEIATAYHGLVSDSQVTQDSNGEREATITIQVPAEMFAPAFSSLKALGDVQRETTDTQDVTKAYLDLETRLRVKRDTAQRLREILRSRTGKLSEVLEVEHELGRVVEQIERMEGERRYLDHQVALSTIVVEIHENQPETRLGLFAPIPKAFRDSVRGLARSVAILVYVVTFLLPWLALATVGWLLAINVRKRLGLHRPTSSI